MRTFNLSRPLMFLSLVFVLPLLTGAKANGCGPGQVVIGNDTGGGDGGTGGNDGGTTVICNCPEEPTVAMLCSDGSTVSPVCGVDSQDQCTWSFPECPPGPCTPAECGVVPTFAEECPNGTTIAPVCIEDPSHECGWSFPTCPTEPCTPAECGAEPSIVVYCDGTPIAPQCEPVAPSGCGWVIAPCLPGGEIDAGGGPGIPDGGPATGVDAGF